MADIYQKALENLKKLNAIDKGVVNHTLAKHGLTDEELRALPGTNGGQILASKPLTVDSLFSAFCAHFDYKETTKWEWTFSVSYLDTRSAELLDGARKTGECKILAGALQLLVNFPAPLGMALAGAELEMHEPTNGFFAFHPIKGVFGVPPDVIHPHCDVMLKNRMQPLCFWTNHKVMKYGGKYYDTSYHATYNAIDEMEAGRVTGMKKAGAKAVLVKRTSAPPDLPGWLRGVTMYMIEVATPQFAGYRGPYKDVA